MCASQQINLSVHNEQLEISFDEDPSQELIKLLRTHKQELIAFISKVNLSCDTLADNISPINRQHQTLYASYAQQRLWLLDKIEGGSAHYHMAGTLRLSGHLKKAMLEASFTALLSRHESLRTHFAEQPDGTLEQVIKPVSEFDLSLEDYRALPQAAQNTAVAHWIKDGVGLPFDLSSDVMLRAKLVHLAKDEYILLVVMHHITADGWSMAILINELCTLYSAFLQGQHNPLPELPIQYADYAHWQRQWLAGDAVADHLQYWQTQLKNLPTVHNLPLDHPRPTEQSFAGDMYTGELSLPTVHKLNSLCQSHSATLFMGLHAAFSVLLARFSNQQDIVVGSPIANRDQAEVSELIGFFVNTLVLRSDLSGNPSFNDVLMQSKEMLLAAYAHQQVPFERIVEVLQPERSLSHAPLFQIMLVLQNNDIGEVSLPGLQVSQTDLVTTASAKFDLTLVMTEHEHGISLEWEYNSQLFEPRIIEKLHMSFTLLLDALLATPEKSVFSANLNSSEDEYRQLVEWNDTKVDFLKDDCIHELYEQQVMNSPDATALVFDGKSLSYKELNQRANQLAHLLVSQYQVTPDTLVGVYAERSFEMVIAILGCLKAGAAYVPLEPGLPESRLAYMIDDAQLSIILTQAHLVEHSSLSGRQVICLGMDVPLEGSQATDNLAKQRLGLSADNLAYVIYTSGSTGKPKGVMNTHQALVNRLDWMSQAYGCTQTERVLQKTPFSFDVSVWEFFLPLITGSVMVLAKPQEHKNPSYLIKLIKAKNITRLHFVPSMLTSMLLGDELAQCRSLKQVFCSGEALSVSQVKRFKVLLPSVELHNLYGPTEAAIDVSFWDCNGETGRNVPIGKPINNVQLLVLDPHLNLVVPGVIGELHIGGVALARGYLQRPELTAEKFIDNPFYNTSLTMSSARLYKTGDLVRQLPDGNLEYMGRIDHQVKIRGFRIELGEIEHVLLAQDKIEDAVVLMDGSLPSGPALVAYVVSELAVYETQQQYQATEILKASLKTKLPEYMVPSAIIFLAQFPLTANGKLDRQLLPAPNELALSTDHTAPETEWEKVLCYLWQDLLGRERVGIHDDFFRLGGHSLLATQLVAKIRQSHHIELPLRTVFESPTIYQLALELGVCAHSLHHTINHVARDEALKVSYAQQRLWLLDKIEGGSAHYHMAGTLRLSGHLKKAMLEASFTALLSRHESLRTHFAEQPDGTLEQVIKPVSEFDLSLEDYRALPQAAQNTAVAHWIKDGVGLPFDLSSDVMLRAKLVHLAKDEYILLVVMHHITADGWSMAILINELCTLYSAFLQGQHNPLPELPIQYADYAHWQRQWLAGDAVADHLQYWQTQLKNLPTVHNLPLDHPRPTEQSFAGDMYTGELSLPTVHKLNSLCQSHSATLFMGLHAAFSVLLARFSNQQDIVVGSPIANRDQAEVSELIGFFVNTLVLRSDLSGNPSFNDVLMQSKEMLLAAYAHQQVPFERIVEVLQPERSLSHAPLFQIMLVLQNNDIGEVSLPGLQVSQTDLVTTASAKFDLTLVMTEHEHGISLEWEYNSQLFEPRIIEKLHMSFTLLLDALLATPEKSVFSANLNSSEDEYRQLVEWNDTKVDFLKDDCIHELYEQQVMNSPDATALVFDGKSLSYKELNQRANQLAHLLVSQYQVTPDTLVGVYAERSFEMVIAILGCLKAGAAYVPLEPGLPESRLAYMIDDAQLSIILTQAHLVEHSSLSGRQVICLGMDVPLEGSQATDNLAKQRLGLSADNLAYVIYTSGSTGKPKGVMNTHQALVNRLDWMSQAYGCTQTERVLQKTPFSFDVSVWEFFLPLITGSVMVLAKPQEHKNPSYLIKLIKAKNITRLHFVPSMLTSMLLGDELAQCRSLKQVFCSGEALSVSQVKRFKVLLPSVELHNLYGPTEAAIDVSFWDCNGETGRNVPIGKPINNVQLLVLDPHLNLVVPGVIGELHIGGVALARGYLQRPELTAEKFIDNPFYNTSLTMSSARLYKTGDLVRQLPDGNLEYMGRIDHQVKIRGFRIELGEIEHVLTQHGAVKSAIALPSADGADHQRIVAFVIKGNNETQDEFSIISEINHSLSEQLPNYMIPSSISLLERWPMTNNGKVDRAALLSLDSSQLGAISEFSPPETATENSLVKIWSELLKLKHEQINTQASFFKLGGHSLLAINLTIQIKSELAVDLTIKQIFSLKNIKNIACAIDLNQLQKSTANNIEQLDRIDEVVL